MSCCSWSTISAGAICSIHGNRLIDTPNIDRIGIDGVTMTQFYAGANVCTPSRAALLTGRYPFRSQMQFVTRPHSDWGLAGSEVTIAELLQSNGYATGMVGKWHLGHRPEYWPTNQGFESFLGVPYSNDMEPFDLYRGSEIVEREIDQTAITAKFADEAARFITANREQPFFLYYADIFPHRPLFFPSENAGRSDAGDYGDVVETMDDAVGQVLDTLDRLDLADTTIVIFTSDNGPWFQGDPGPWRGRKGGAYDGGYRVPMLVRWPGTIRGGRVNSEMAAATDILPTLARISGTALPEDRTIDGRDISAMWTANASSPHNLLYFFDGNDLAAVRNSRFKLQLKDYYRTFAVPFKLYAGPKLFDLRTDPLERYDVSSRHSATFAALMSDADRMAALAKDNAREPGPVAPPPGAALGPKLDVDD